MRILVAVHGYPPEMHGGTEHSVATLVRGLLRLGHHVTVLAGTDRAGGHWEVTEDLDRDPQSGREARVVRVQRGDLYYGHWSKALHPGVSRLLAELLARERSEVLHVHHWLRLSRDLVATAARAGVPAVVSLHDAVTNCLVHHRVRPATWQACEVPLAPDPCLACATGWPPVTPWRGRDEQAAELQRHREEFGRELSLARAITVLSDDQAERLRPHVPPAVVERGLVVLPPARGKPLQPRRPHAAPQGREPLLVGHWSGLHPLKGTDLLVEAIAELKRLDVPVELRLAGFVADTAFERRLRERAADLPVRFLGPFGANLDRHEATDVHCFAAASRARETWSLVADEAAELRLPLALPRLGAPARRYEGHGALLHEPGSIAGLASDLARMRNEPGLLGGLRNVLARPALLRPTEDEAAAAFAWLYDLAVRAGPPEAPPRDVAGEERDLAAVAAWDAAIARHTPKQLGLA